MASSEPASPEELQRFREELAKRVSDDERRLKKLNRASLVVLVSGVIGVIFFVAATVETTRRISRFKAEKLVLENEREKLEQEVIVLSDTARALRGEIDTLKEQHLRLTEWSDATYDRLEDAAQQDQLESVKALLDSTPPPPTSSQKSEARQLWREGQSAARTGDIARAESRYIESLKADPNQPRALNSLGLLRHRQKRFDEALELYLRAVNAAASYGPAIGNIGNLLFQRGQVAEAIVWCARGLELPEPPELTLQLERRLAGVGYQCTLQDAAERFFRDGEHLVAMKKFVDGLPLISRGCELGSSKACRVLARLCRENAPGACEAVAPTPK